MPLIFPDISLLSSSTSKIYFWIENQRCVFEEMLKVPRANKFPFSQKNNCYLYGQIPFSAWENTFCSLLKCQGCTTNRFLPSIQVTHFKHDFEDVFGIQAWSLKSREKTHLQLGSEVKYFLQQ